VPVCLLALLLLHHKAGDMQGAMRWEVLSSSQSSTGTPPVGTRATRQPARSRVWRSAPRSASTMGTGFLLVSPPTAVSVRTTPPSPRRSLRKTIVRPNVLIMLPRHVVGGATQLGISQSINNQLNMYPSLSRRLMMANGGLRAATERMTTLKARL
jgi:hypothetical protein